MSQSIPYTSLFEILQRTHEVVEESFSLKNKPNPYINETHSTIVIHKTT